MKEPREPPASETDRPPGEDVDTVPTEPIVGEPIPDLPASGEALLPTANGELGVDGVGQGPMREIAAAFRMNAEALHTLKQMQVEIAANVKRGDRSELVLQSTRALNDTFRNLSSVQRELLSRLDKPHGGGGRGPLIPLMLLGLLIVFVAGIYVILTEVQDSKAAKPGVEMMVDAARRERDSWKEGRREGAQQSDSEIQRLREALEEAKERSRTIQQTLDAKTGDLDETDRRRRAAEIERDEFAGQVRKAQSEVMAKKALEDEIHTLRSEKKSTDREVTDLEVSLDRKRREVGWLRQRLADYGMDLPSDDPPYVPPGQDADPLAAGAPERPRSKPPSAKSKYLNLVQAGQKKIAEQAAADADAEAEAEAKALDASRVPPPVTGADPAPMVPTSTPGAIRGGDRAPAGAAPRDVPWPAAPARKPGELPPPIMRRRGGLERSPVEVQRVRGVINRLLDSGAGRNGESWQLTRIDGVSQSGLGGVILLRYDASGRMVDGIEAKALQINHDRETRTVEFVVHDGVRVGQNRRVPLPPQGAKVIVAEGEGTSAWASSGLTMIRKK